MLKLYHCAGSRGFRALWTLEEMGLAHQLLVLPFPPRFLAREYLEINPLGTVPALVDGEVTMTESVGIAQYLVTRYGPSPLAVGVDEPDYAAYLDYLHHADATLTFPQTVYLRFTVFEAKRGLSEAGELYAKWFIARLVKLERRLSDREFLCAGRFTVADIAIAFALQLARQVGLGDRLPPVLSAYLDRLSERPAFIRARAAEGEMPKMSL